MNFDVAVIGGGIVGAACAAELVSVGLRIVVIEEKTVASGTTAAGMGHIVVMDDSEAQFALTSYSQRLWDEISDELPTKCEFDRCGTIWVAVDEDEMIEVRRRYDRYASRGLRAEVLDPQSLRQAEPNLREGLAGGLLIPGDGVIYQLFATRHFIQKAVSQGAELVTGDNVIAIGEDGLLLGSGLRIKANAIVNAAGVSAASLTPELVITRRKGHLVISGRRPGFARHQLVELGYLKSAHGGATESVAFNIQPRATGQLLLGSSRQSGVDTDVIDHSILRRMMVRAFEYMPDLRKLDAVRIWTGLRPATPDNLPYIGRLNSRGNVYAAAGHEGLGITMSLGTAKLIADAILDRTPEIDPKPFSPNRMGSKDD